MQQNTAVFANFICRFGNEVLLDYLDEIVLKAFLDDTMVRKYGDTFYHLYEVKLENLGSKLEPVMALTGQFVKDTTLRRVQIFNPNEGLVKKSGSLKSSPSSFFILLLNNHRLIYFAETAGAPDIATFRATMHKFLMQKRASYIDEEWKRRKRSEKITKTALHELVPVPTLAIVPLTAADNLKLFLERFKVLKKIEFKLIEPNHEIDGAKLLGDMKNYFKPLRPDDLKISASRKDGLDQKDAAEKIEDATVSGNQEVKLSGIDGEGNKLSGDNEAFQLVAPISPLPETRSGLTEKLYEVFQHLVRKKVIVVPTPRGEMLKVIHRLVNTLL